VNLVIFAEKLVAALLACNSCETSSFPCYKKG